ncbi:MAG TPA: SGNH/GDSL hydrolase family protein [Polyangiaceae bacterium]|nr:SGNH/GDSL hydrolase family protein [Polyangiaceae bacterium]
MRAQTRTPHMLGYSAALSLALGAIALTSACSSDPASTVPGSALGGATAATGGASAAGGTSAQGGAAAGGSSATGGISGQGGASTTGGAATSGGTTSASNGGSSASSGGGTGAAGGASGGAAGASTGGKSSIGGSGAGGTSAGSGGSSSSGGSSGGGKSSTGGAGGTSGGSTATGGSGGGTGGAGGAGGASGFNPCPPAGTPCKVLPLGDSITDGIGFSGGYRVELFHLANTDKKSITYLGGSMNGPSQVDGVTFPKNHEGHSGWTIQQIDNIVPSPALQTTPHIILLHIGTNDMYQTPSGAPDRLSTLIDQIVMAAPEALLVVAKIIPFPQQSGQVTTFNTGVGTVVDAKIKAGKHLILVDQFTGFPTSELGDGVHPNQAGYSRMAKVWYEAIKTYLH